jgi:hypothetical protein
MCGKILDLFEASDDKENKYERIKHELENIELNEEEKILYDQLINSEQDYENITDLLNKNKEDLNSHLSTYNDLVQRLRNLQEIEGELDTIMKKAEESGLMTTTYKQVDKHMRGKPESIDRNKPFGQDNIILLPL